MCWVVETPQYANLSFEDEYPGSIDLCRVERSLYELVSSACRVGIHATGASLCIERPWRVCRVQDLFVRSEGDLQVVLNRLLLPV
jgi:hypothetical protein